MCVRMRRWARGKHNPTERQFEQQSSVEMNEKIVTVPETCWICLCVRVRPESSVYACHWISRWAPKRQKQCAIGSQSFLCYTLIIIYNYKHVYYCSYKYKALNSQINMHMIFIFRHTALIQLIVSLFLFFFSHSKCFWTRAFDILGTRIYTRIYVNYIYHEYDVYLYVWRYCRTFLRTLNNNNTVIYSKWISSNASKQW